MSSTAFTIVVFPVPGPPVSTITLLVVHRPIAFFWLSASAIVIPLVFALLWPSGLRKAGAITGVALAALLHVTIAVGAVTFAYQLAEFRWRVWAPPKTWLKLLVTALALGAVVLTYWMFRHYESCNACG